MTSTWSPTNSTEPVEVQLFTHAGAPLLGKTDIKVQVRRIQDDHFLDWTDNLLKTPSSVTARLLGLEEVSAAYNPGLYRLNTWPHINGLNLAAILNHGLDDIYDVTIMQDGGTDATGLPIGFELKAGALADKIQALPNSVANAVWDTIQADHTLAGSFGLLLQRVVALQKENYFIDSMTYNTQGLMLTGRIRLFHTKADALAATPGGIGESEFATYSFDTTSISGRPERAATARSVRDV